MTGQERTEDGAAQPPVWVDDGPIDPTWSEPTASGRGRRRLFTVGIPVLALIVLIGSVWALGGFGDRNDTVTKIGIGKTFVNGPYEFSFSKATVQETAGYGKHKRIQKVVVTGTARNLGDKAMSPLYRWFLARGKHGTRVETSQTAMVGDPGQFYAPDDVTPGLPAAPLNVTFEFPPTFDDETLIFAVGELTYGNHSYFSSGDDQSWDTGNGNVFRVQLPLTRLPAEQT